MSTVDDLLAEARVWIANGFPDGLQAERYRTLASALSAERFARLDALGFVQQTIYTNSDNPSTVAWRNDEVLSMLQQLEELLIVAGPVAESPS